MRTRRDLLLALAVAALAMGFYLRTMLPGVGGGGDTTKFQYIGSVLGTAHPPGYPLYIFVSYAFAHLPFGTPAYRINFMSGCFAAGAAAVIFLLLVRLDCRRVVAFSMAASLALDRFLWGKATGAEVYSLGGFLIALVAWLALRWAATGRDRDLYLMVAAFALSLGNHLTVAMFAPALAVFVLMVKPRAVRPVTVAVSAMICVIGLAQYGFIILRTRQQSPYVEAHATNLRELYATVRAARYADEIFAFSTRQLAVDRLPLLWQKALAELNPVGAGLVLIGLAAAASRRPAAAVLFGLGAAGVMFLTLNVDADVDGFLVGAVVLLWPLAGLGFDALWSGLARAGRSGVVVASGLAVAMPLWQIDRNYKFNDHHRRTFEIRYLNALFAGLEDKVAFVREVYPVDQLILYKVAGEHANGTRTVTIVPADPAAVQAFAKNGFTVYAFTNGRQALEGRGLGFEPIQLRPPPGAVDGEAIDMTPLPLFRLARRAECLPVGNSGWRDVSHLVSDGRAMLRIDNYRPFDSTTVLYVAGTHLLPPFLVISQGPYEPRMSFRTFRTSLSNDADQLARALTEDAVPGAEALRRQATVHRLLVQVNDQGQFSQMAIAFGGRTESAWVRASVDLNNPLRATVCGWSARDFFSDERRTEEQVPLGSDGDALFGRGWRPAERGEGGRDVRWTTEPHAEVVLPLAQPSGVQVRVRARPWRTDVPARTIALSVNGHAAPPHALELDWQIYEWDIPAEQLLSGLNRVTIDLMAGARAAVTNADALTVGVGELALIRKAQ